MRSTASARVDDLELDPVRVEDEHRIAIGVGVVLARALQDLGPEFRQAAPASWRGSRSKPSTRIQGS
jgi:hypothetical protein